MKHIYPSAYRKFSCIASACRHTCCVGWELPVDARTARRYLRMHGETGACIRATLNESADAFVPTRDGRCPHLDERNLCRLITDGSQKLLCEVCREHPRYHNHHRYTATEHGLGLSCEEACRLLLTTPLSFVFDNGATVDPRALRGFGAERLREKYHLINRILDPSGTLEERIALIGADRAVSLAPEALCTALSILSRLEWMEEGSASVFSRVTSFSPLLDNYSLQYSNFLALTLYRTATDGRDLSAALSFSVFLLRLLDALMRERSDGDVLTLLECARIVSAEIEYNEENTERLLTYFEEKNLLASYKKA